MRRCLLASYLLISSVTAAQAPAATASSFGHYQPRVQYTERISTSFYLPMRDGVLLAIRVSRPARNGKPADGRFPVIWQGGLTVTEAGETGIGGAQAGYQGVPTLTRFGYVVAQVARRGNGQSLGVRRGYNDRTESDDAYEITEWLAAQPWANGRVGVYGCSNTGDAAMHTLAARPPHLRAAFAGCFSWSKYDAMHRGGIFAQWGTGPQRTIEQDMAIEPVDGDDSRTLLRQAAEDHQRSTNLLQMWKDLPFRDSHSTAVASRFWAEGSVASYAAQLRQGNVPLYIQGGWHDELRDQGLVALLNLPRSRILIGPWRHCMNPGFELLQEMHRFFDTYLKGADTGLAREPRVHYFTMDGLGAGQWRVADNWPVAGMAIRQLRLAEGGALLAGGQAGTLGTEFGVRTDLHCPDAAFGPFQQPCPAPGDGASFSTGLLEQALEVTGNPVLSIGISTDRADANLFAYLEDVAPDGAITEVTEGRLRASLRAEATPPFKVPGTPWHRAFQEDSRLLAAGEAARLRFDLLPTSHVFAAGHRVRLTLAGADYRERERDPSVDGMRLRLLGDPREPAVLELPIVLASEPR